MGLVCQAAHRIARVGGVVITRRRASGPSWREGGCRREEPGHVVSGWGRRLRYLPSVPMMPRTAAGRSAGRTTTLALSVSAILRMEST